MDPNEILKQGLEVVKHAPEFATGAATVIGAFKFTEITKAMLGPAANEIAERIHDQIRLYRFGRQIELLRKAENMAREAGFTPKAVPVKLLFPLLEGASLEDSEPLHDLWAALLANASNLPTAELVRPSFVEVLKTLTPETAKLLDVAFEQAADRIKRESPSLTPRADSGTDQSGIAKPNVAVYTRMRAMSLVDLGTFREIYRLFEHAGCVTSRPPAPMTNGMIGDAIVQDEVNRQRFAVAMDDLQRLHFWTIGIDRGSGEHYYLTPSAVQFVTVCRAPATSK